MDTGKPIIEENRLDILKLIGILIKYKLLMFIITCIIFLVSLVFLTITKNLPASRSPFPDNYKASTILLINEKSSNDILSNISLSLNIKMGLSGASTYGLNRGELVMKILRTNIILDEIAGEFKIKERYGIKRNEKGRSRNRLLSNLSVAYEEKTMTMIVSYEDYDPVFASDITNRFIDLLDKRFMAIQGNKSIVLTQSLEIKLSELLAKIAGIEIKLKQFQKKYGFIEIDNLSSEQVTILARLRSQLILKEIDIKTYLQFSNIEDPVIKKLRVEKENLLEVINEIESGFSEFTNVFLSQNDLPDLALEYYHLKRDLDVQESIYELLIKEYEIIRLSMEGQEPFFQIIEKAEVPDFKAGPNRGVLLLLSGIVGFAFSVFFILVFVGIKTILSNPRNIMKLTGKELS